MCLTQLVTLKIGILLIHSAGTPGLILCMREQYCYAYIVAYRQVAITTGRKGKSYRVLQGDPKPGGHGDGKENSRKIQLDCGK
jgi:hypothetical protein